MEPTAPRRPTAPRVALTAALVALVAAWCATPAGAQSAPSSVRSPITDEAGALSPADEGAVERTLEAARAQGVDLHVLFVSATGGRPMEAYAESVAAQSSMSGDDALLAVAFQERTYALWLGDRFRISGREIEAILDRLVAPRLRAGDVPGAVAATVDGIRRADSGQTTDPRSRGGGGGLPLLPLLLLGVVVLFVLRRLFSRRRSGGHVVQEHLEPEAPPVDVEALAAEANATLLRVDDQLQDAEHESGFAEAQFGAQEGAALREGLERARGELRQAFALRQRLDDHVPDPPGEQVAMLEGIMAHARAAESIAQERLQRLEELRGLERDPARAVADIQARRGTLAARVPAAEATIAELRANASRAAAAVDGNAAEADKRLAFVDERLQEAAGAAAPVAAQALRAAGAALAQAEQLLDAVEDLAGRVRHARDVLPQELQEAELALARAEDLVRSRRHFVGREARTRVVEARRRFDQARGLVEQDPAAAAAEADAAERLADEAFELAWRDSESGRDDDEGHGGGGGIQSFGWGLPVPIALPFPIGGGIGWGGTSWGGRGGGFGGVVGGGSFGGGSAGGGRW